MPRWWKTSQRAACAGATCALALWMGGCAVEWQNREAARELANEDRPLSSAYAGWRIFQDKCASCHGPDALGTANAPNLLPLVQKMGPHEFMDAVLKRYDWDLPPDQARQAQGQGKPHDALVDALVQRQTRLLSMPAWQGEPAVNVHIADLYSYVSGRAQGTQGPGRPRLR